MLKPPTLTGIILAGGKSSRMGTDKAFLLLEGKPFIAHTIETIKSCTKNVLLVGNDQKLDVMGIERFPDRIPECGPMGGIYTGLFHSKTEYNLVLACDTPFLTKGTLDLLIGDIDKKHDVFTVRCAGVNLPLIGIYRKSRAPYFAEAIDRGDLALKKLLSTLQTKTIELPKSHSKSVMNINTMADLKKMEAEN